MFSETLQLLWEFGLKPNRRTGQHHVIDPTFLELMVDYSKLTGEDVVLEIGAGTGNLTRLLARYAKKVIAVERDKGLMKVLLRRFRGFPNVDLLHGDALRLAFPDFNKVVSNLPYSISSDIMFTLLKHEFEIAVLMFQKEFAKRLVAKPGTNDYSRLTVNTYYRAGVELLDEISPKAFFPQPKVTSAIVRLKPRRPPFKLSDESLFFNLVRALFQHRRQRVRNALMRSYGIVFPDEVLPKSERRSLIDKKLAKGLSETRVMDLAPEKFGEMANLFSLP